MKIAVYAIAKNEEQFVQRWADSCKEADYRFILDTGSTDNTVAQAKQAGVDCRVRQFTPWRFDHARNRALSMLPQDIDICIALDMDEVLQPGWRQALEAMPRGVTRPRYKYVWSWKDDGSEGLVYGGDKIHTRHNYRWKHPVHEVIKPLEIEETQFWVDGLEIHHHPDKSKSRSQYFDLLKLAVREEPADERNRFYLAREYYFHGNYDKASENFEYFLALSKWAPERAAACRYMASMHKHRRPYWLYRALSEDSGRRENWIALAMMHYEQNDWVGVKSCCEMALRIKEKPLDYLCDANAWDGTPYDLLALACWNLGDAENAVLFGRVAVEKSPSDARLISNLNWYKNGFTAIS